VQLLLFSRLATRAVGKKTPYMPPGYGTHYIQRGIYNNYKGKMSTQKKGERSVTIQRDA